MSSRCAFLCGLILMLHSGADSALAAYTYYHNNELGSPVAATDATGVLIWRAHYRPFGRRSQTTQSFMASLDNSLWFTGHAHDEVTDLTYMLARYYDPGIGRFLAVDSAPFRDSDPQSFNRYSYARNNPYRYVDPDGRESLVFSWRRSFSLGAGAGTAAGVYFTFPLSANVPFDAGFLTASSLIAGADLATTANISLLTGGRENLEGTSVSVNATLPLTGVFGPAIDAELIINPETGKFAGGSLGIGSSLLPTISASASKSHIRFSLRDFLSDEAGFVQQEDPGASEPWSEIDYWYPGMMFH